MIKYQKKKHPETIISDSMLLEGEQTNNQIEG